MYHTHSLFLRLRLIALVLLAIMQCQVLSADERNVPDGQFIDSGTLLLSNATTTVNAVQLDATMNVTVSGLLAQLTLTQTFRNTHDLWMQARYLFPLPESASVQALMIKTGDRIVHGKIMERQAAKKTFDSASESGQITGLVEQQRPNLFTMDVANVAPNSELTVTLTIMLPVDTERSWRSLTLPTTHTPRYTNNITPLAQNVTGAFTDTRQQRGPRLTLTMAIEGIKDYAQVSSDSHVLAIRDDSIIVNDTPMDRDVVINWPANDDVMAKSEIYTSIQAQERYAQILLNPPSAYAQSTARRELVIVVDKSGSMAGESIIAARKALQFALENLNPDDQFNIIAFDDQSYPLFTTSQTANDENLRFAKRFVKYLDAEGGTEMRESLDIALTPGSESHDGRLKQIVFMTDGSVGYEDELLLDIKRQIGNSRLFTIGIGSAPNQWFLNKAAEVGRGIALSIPDSHAAADAIENLLSHLSNPVITDVSVQFIGGRGEIYPNPIPDLYADKPQMLASRLSTGVTEILVSGNRQVNNEVEPWQQRLNVAPKLPPGQPSSDMVPAIKLFWTRLKVASLLDEQRYAKDTDLHKSAITQLAINAQLLTPYTSFVAVEEQTVRPTSKLQHNTEVASLIPHGSQMMNIVMPQGSAGVDTLSWLSALLAMAGMIMIYLSRNTLRIQ